MRHISLALFAVVAVITLSASLPAEAQQPAVANVAPAPPLGGLTQVVAGTTDIQALIDAQTFEVESIWKLDIATQQFLSYVVGAPAFVNTLSALDPADVVTIKAAPPPSLTLLASFEGVASQPGHWHPDDTIAVGPDAVLLVGNSTITIRDKSGALRASTTVFEFFAPVLAIDEGVGDPWLLFDPGSQRFFYVADGAVADRGTLGCDPGSCVSHHLLAVSKSASPRSLTGTDWYFYALDRTVLRTVDGIKQTATWGDFDSLAIDDDVVLIKWWAVAFGFTAGGTDPSQGVKLRILDKSKLIAGEPITTWTDIELRDPETGALWRSRTEPAIGSGNAAPLFVVGRGGGCNVTIWAIETPLASPTLSTRNVSVGEGCDDLPTATQPGGAAAIDVIVYGHSLVYRNGSLWYAFVDGQDLGSGTVSVLRWFQLDVSAWPDAVTVKQDGVFGSEDSFVLGPAIMVDTDDNVVIVFARTSATEFPSLYYTWRRADDPLNSLQPAVLLQRGVASWEAFNEHTGSRNRYIDFLGTALDPSDGSIWVFGPYVRAPGDRGTWVANVAFEP